MTALGARLGLVVYAFGPRDVNWSKGVVYGFHARHPHGPWSRRAFPLPSVLYDQTKSRRLAASRSCKSLKARLVRRGTILLGPGFLSKNGVAAVLRRVPELKDHLPEMAPATAANVRRLLARHGVVYIKHPHGTLGQNVIRVSRTAEGGYLWQAAVGYKRTVRHRLSGPAALSHRLGRRRHWLAQQGIDLCRYAGRPADIRLLLQKDDQGKWRLTVGFAKVAGAGQVVTNIGAGGSLRGLDELLRRARAHYHWEASVADLRERLIHVGVLTATALDRGIGPLAELGIDVGLDQRARVWLIEANGKYSRAVFGRRTRQLTIRRVLQYAKHLHQNRRGAVKNGNGAARNGVPMGLPEVLQETARALPDLAGARPLEAAESLPAEGVPESEEQD